MLMCTGNGQTNIKLISSKNAHDSGEWETILRCAITLYALQFMVCVHKVCTRYANMSLSFLQSGPVGVPWDDGHICLVLGFE